MSEEPPNLSDDEVVALLPAFEEAARANQRTIDRFVEPRIGIVAQTLSRHHHFVLGRRGVGKSTLLRKVEAEAQAMGSAVISMDLETVRSIPTQTCSFICFSGYSRI